MDKVNGEHLNESFRDSRNKVWIFEWFNFEHNLSCNQIQIKKGVASREKQVIVPLYSAAVNPITSTVSRPGPPVKKSMELLEWVQGRATETIRGLERFS